jgi:hypothetical protein
MTVSRANNSEKHKRKIQKEMKNFEGSDKCLSTKLTIRKQLKKKTSSEN